jgi:diguanylate cyclase (GGDEF)-like protein
MFPLLIHHKNKVLFLISLLLITLVSNLSVGKTKTWQEIDWLDVIGEGGSAFAIGLWVLFILGSRPLGRVTDLLSLGLGFMLLAFWQDTLDEFIRIPVEYWWDQGFESIAMPMGIMLLTYGLYHWHQEQIAINDQLRNREQYFREHLSVDKLTNLGRIDFLRYQIDRFIKVCPQAKHSLLILDVENFSDMNRTYGTHEGDCYLHALSELLILNLRKQDLLCRYAGDRFAIVLPNTDDIKAREISTELTLAVDHFAFKSKNNNQTLYQKVSIGIACGRGLSANNLIYLANKSLKHKKPLKFVA